MNDTLFYTLSYDNGALEVGRDRELLQSKKGEPMMDALRLRKSGFYDDKKRVLLVWPWGGRRKVPQRMEHIKFHIVLLVHDKALKGRELYLFDTNPKKADSFLQIKNGQIHKIN